MHCDTNLLMMKVSRIVFFALVLFVLQAATGALVTLKFGVATSSSEVLGGYIAGTVVSIFVFAYMSWVYPIKPYMNAFAVSFLAALFGAFVTTLLVGDMSWWHPTTLVFDIPELLMSVLLGTSLGASLRRRRAANL